MKRRIFILLALACAACAEAVEPVDPVWGKQPCASCGMVVGDRRHAAQLLPASGARVYFDDPGCLVTYLAERKIAPQGVWVREAGGERWLDARTARYVKGARTPMDFGFEARADEGVSFDAFSAEVREKRERKGSR
jgi:copper chaperone NosL